MKAIKKTPLEETKETEAPPGTAYDSVSAAHSADYTCWMGSYVFDPNA